MMTFTGGDKTATNAECKNVSLSSSIMLLCDPEKSVSLKILKIISHKKWLKNWLFQGDFSFLYYDSLNCRFYFELRLSDICEGGTGLSGWTIFFIL